jgi:hypothetical protein
MLINYIIVVTGQLEAPSEDHAQAQVLMGVTLTGRLMSTPHEMSVKVGPVPETRSTPAPSDGEHPIPFPLQEH